MPTCFNCQAPVMPEDRFCGNCGTRLQPAGQPSPTPAVRAAGAEAQGAGVPSSGEGEREAGGTSAMAASASAASSANSSPSNSSPANASSAGSSPANSAPAAAGQSRAGEPSANQSAAHDERAFDEEPAPSEPLSVGDESPASDADESPASDADAPSKAGAHQSDAPPAPEFEATLLESSTPPARVEPLASAPADTPTNAPLGGEPWRPAPPHFDEMRRSTGDVSSRTSRGGATGGRRHQSKQLDAGTLLNNRYEIVRRIGGGGMGAVYYAKDKNLGDAPRAVKEMIQSQLDETQHEKAIGDFKRESMLLASLEHASIPTIYDYFYDDAAARFYLVMKYISGGDFLSRLRNAPGGRIDEQTVADWGVQVADVLDYLHNRRPPIIYRDLKPANLMIDGNSGRVMLIDFGIARWVAPQEKGVTAVGTMGYAPPELFSGKVEPRSDIYSLGATMFHLLTGADPQDNPLLIFDFTKNPRPRQIAPSISNEMERILMRAVEYKPEGRFRSAAEFRDALAQHLEKLRTGAVSYGGVAVALQGGEKTIAVEMVYCGFCGGRIAADDLFCAHCGAKQPLAGASATLRTARATAKLVVMGTTELDASFQLHKETNLIGRIDPNSNIFPEIDLSKFDPETKISRRHARIWREGDTFLVEDLGSVNGTVVNNTIRLGARQPRVLENGDKLRLGETTLHFLIG